MKKFSVLISVYKRDNPVWIEEALNSIYDGQIRKPDEIYIVIDGPVPDSIKEILFRFKDKNKSIVVLHQIEKNVGLGEALKIGSEKCKGDYIFRMDSDDISHPLRFQKQIEYIEKHPDVDVLGGNICEFIESINEKIRVRMCPVDMEGIIKLSKIRNPMNHVTVCIKKESLMKCGGYEGLLLLEDYYLWVKMISSGMKLENINEILVYVRLGREFEERRGDPVRIKGWFFIQKFMLRRKMIGILTLLCNMVGIIVFTYAPVGLRKFIYRKFLRRNIINI